jgi:hypothetical protein
VLTSTLLPRPKSRDQKEALTSHLTIRVGNIAEIQQYEDREKVKN